MVWKCFHVNVRRAVSYKFLWFGSIFSLKYCGKYFVYIYLNINRLYVKPMYDFRVRVPVCMNDLNKSYRILGGNTCLITFTIILICPLCFFVSYTVCGLSCDVGFVANSSCNGCVSVCDMFQPCGQFGSCHLNSSEPDGYMCMCSVGYTGQNCTDNPEEPGV